MSLEKQKLVVDGEEYLCQLKPPSCADILRPSAEQLAKRLNVEVYRGETILVDKQQFIGYTFFPKSIEDVNVAYAKIRALHTDGRHAICSFRMPGRSFHTQQDFFDDDEHNGGSYLLNLLTAADIQSRAIVVVRIYDGTHIGPRRFNAIFDAAKSAVEKMPRNVITGKLDKVWYLDNRANNGKYPGRYQNRGMRGGHNTRGGKHHSYAEATKSPPAGYGDGALGGVTGSSPVLRNRTNPTTSLG